MRYFQISLLLILIVLFSCAEKEPPEAPEKILARVGNKTISKAEFIRRAEFTIRPTYARGSSNVEKKIVLNSLLAEKMLALEAGEQNELTENPRFQRYIEGRQEQAMRQWLYHIEAERKVIPDTAQIRKAYHMAGRKYRLQYFSFEDEKLANTIQDMIRNHQIPFEDIYREISGGKPVPERELGWHPSLNRVMLEALFEEPDAISKDQVVGPLKIGDSQYMVIKVKGWQDEVLLADTDIIERKRKVEEYLVQEEAQRIYDRFISDVMKGRKIEFNRDVFAKVVNLIGPLYLQSSQQKEDLFLNQTMDKKLEMPDFSQTLDNIDALRDQPLFTYEGQVWTAGMLEEELDRHPLVFRKRRMKNKEFGEQFKFAVADLLRDKALTKIAYDRNYDQLNSVKRHTNMWRDALISQHQKENILDALTPDQSDSLKTVRIIEKFLNPYIDELQSKYGDQTEVDIETFNEIELTDIDMFVTQRNVPFPILVPAFPRITTDYKLDYGKKMASEPKQEQHRESERN